MAQFILKKRIKNVEYYERLGRPCTMVYFDDGSRLETTPSDFAIQVQHVAESDEMTRFETAKSAAYENFEQER